VAVDMIKWSFCITSFCHDSHEQEFKNDKKNSEAAEIEQLRNRAQSCLLHDKNCGIRQNLRIL